MIRECIIVSPYFPPSTLAGVHRARHLAKHLPAAGWHPIVLCVDEAYHEERLDPALAELVPSSTDIIRVPATPAQFTRPFGLGDISLRAFWPLRRELFRLLSTRPIGAVMITGSPYYPMLLAPSIRRRFGVPVILDFQDPWVSVWGATQPCWTKPGLAHGLAKCLEPKALRGASFVTSVSDTQNDQMVERYPWLDRQRMAAIPIGSDTEDYLALSETALPDSEKYLPSGKIIISYVGTFMPRTGPLVEALFRALSSLKLSHPDLARRVQVNFIGTSNQPNEFQWMQVIPLAEAAGLADMVLEVPQRIPYIEAINVLANSNGVLLIGSDEPHYTASKIYPALMSGRPFISLFHRNSSAHDILSLAGGGIALAFDTLDELAGLSDTLCQSLYRLTTAPNSLGRADPSAYAPYTAEMIARRFADILGILE